MTRNLLVLALLSVIPLVGCDDVKPPAAIGTDKLAPGDYPRNVSVNPDLAKALRAGPTIFNEGSANQPMSVSQPMRNLKDFPIEIQYQYEFFDPQGRKLQSSGGWRNLTMEPRVERFLDGAALDTNAVDWRLTIRPAR